jgi:ribosomal protein L12E/L44/L45/RPP1/RPP2
MEKRIPMSPSQVMEKHKNLFSEENVSQIIRKIENILTKNIKMLVSKSVFSQFEEVDIDEALKRFNEVGWNIAIGSTPNETCYQFSVKK